VGFKEDLERVQASRTAEREELSRLQKELARLLDGAAVRLHQATEVLAAARVPTAEAGLAHKQRQTGNGRLDDQESTVGSSTAETSPRCCEATDGWLRYIIAATRSDAPRVRVPARN
jgi:hypothetical protein